MYSQDPGLMELEKLLFPNENFFVIFIDQFYGAKGPYSFGVVDATKSRKKRKFGYSFRLKWITADAQSIDDFINTYENLAEMMRRWKEKGIKIDSDIDVILGDDYTWFCTYDENVAKEEGFYEEFF